MPHAELIATESIATAVEGCCCSCLPSICRLAQIMCESTTLLVLVVLSLLLIVQCSTVVC